jgi:hypothetical protein
MVYEAEEMRYNPPLATTPDDIQQIAMGIILAKANRAKRAYQSYRRLHQLQQRQFMPAASEWLLWTSQKLRAGLSRMHGKSAAAKVNSLANWAEIRARGVELLKPALLEALAVGGNSAMGQRIRKQDRFDVIGVEAVKWTTEHSAAAVVEITEETMLAIRTYIEAGVKAGKSIQKIAMELRPLVGLTEKNIFAVANFEEMLILERPEWTAAQQRQSAEVYARKLHRRRATTIARTETAEALTEGQRQGYGQMGIKQLMRIEDPAAEDEPCAFNNGTIYSLAAASGVLPEHPNCEGSWIAVV